MTQAKRQFVENYINSLQRAKGRAFRTSEKDVVRNTAQRCPEGNLTFRAFLRS